MARLTVLLTALIATTALVAARPPQRSQPGTTQYSRPDATVIATRLYPAMLGREATAAEISRLTAEIQRGTLAAQVNALAASGEFRSLSQRLNAAQLLEQIYRGLLGREPDTAGVNAYLSRLQSRRYADVIVEMTGSREFREKNLGPAAPPATPAPTRLEAALDCQQRALGAARREASGLVFWSFDRMPEVSGDGRAVSGSAVDRFDNDRPLTYRCEAGQATYAYADRGRVAGADRRLEFPSAAVRSCMAAATDDAGRPATFDAASLSASDTRTEYVIGLLSNTAIHVTCEMDGTRVVNLRRR